MVYHRKVLDGEMQHQLRAGVRDAIEIPLDTALRIALEEVAEFAVEAMISQGLPLSSIVDGITVISDKRGYVEATGLLERVAQLLQEDETIPPAKTN